LVLVPIEVGRRIGRELERLVDEHEVARLRGDLDRLPGLHLGARNVHATAVHQDVAVRDELPGLPLREREPQAKHHGVQARLELADQLLAGDAPAAARAVVVDAHLALADPVDRAELLLLEQPDLVLREALASAAGLARAPAHAMTGSGLVHAGTQGTNPAARLTPRRAGDGPAGEHPRRDGSRGPRRRER